VETKNGSDDDDPPTRLMKYKLGRDTVAHTIDFVEAYHHVQVATVPMTMDDVYNHPDPIHRDKWHKAIERELQMTMWKSSPSLVGMVEGGDHFTMKMPNELYWMLVKKFIWKDKSMDKSVKE